MQEPTSYNKLIRESAGMRIGVLFGSFFIFLLFSSIMSSIFKETAIFSSRTQLLLSSVFQCIFAFCLPSYILARFSSDQPLRWLKITNNSGIRPYMGVVIVYLISLPAMEWLIEWNSNISFPATFKGMENVLRGWEESNASVSNQLLAIDNWGGIISGILVIGVLTGFSEELFFRGGLQGIFIRANIGAGMSVWLAAMIFSVMHFQFFGFFPRLLMGVFFGYLLIWTNDLKVSAFAHILNNSVVVITSGLTGMENLTTGESGFFSELSFIPFVSLGMTLLFFILFRGYFFKSAHTSKHLWQKKQFPQVSET